MIAGESMFIEYPPCQRRGPGAAAMSSRPDERIAMLQGRRRDAGTTSSPRAVPRPRGHSRAGGRETPP